MSSNNNVVYAVQSFQAENEDELNFKTGEPIVILEKDEKYQDGWWQGRNINGETGLFPKSYINQDLPQKLLQHKQNKIKTMPVEEVDQLPSLPTPDTLPGILNDTKNPEQWSVQQVADWLGSVGLMSVSCHFIDQEITGDILLNLDIDTLKELNISTFGKRYKIMQAIQTLKEDASLIIIPPTTNASVSTGLLSMRKVKLKRSTSCVRKEQPISPSSLPSPGVSRSNSSMRRNKAPPIPIPSNSTPILNKDMYKFSIDENCASETFEVPEHEGWLHKQSDKYKTWNKRWFVLKGVNLFYFKSPKDVRMKGIINLRGYKLIMDEKIYAGEYCFKIQHDRERTFYFYTETEESMRQWVKMLLKTTILRDFRAPVMSSNHVATIPLEIAQRMKPRPPSVIMYNKNQKQLKVAMTTCKEEDSIDPQHETVTSIVK